MTTLTIAAAMEGLIRSAETIHGRVEVLLQRTRSTSSFNLAHSVLHEVTSFKNLLPQIRRCLEDDTLPKHDMVYVDQLTTTLAGCMKRFAELEGMLGNNALEGTAQRKIHDQPTWIRNEKRIQVVAESLGPYRVSFSLILEVLQL